MGRGTVLKKILLGGLVVVVALLVGVSLWARSVLGGDTVRTALAAQLAEAIGQPVAIGGVRAGVYPRVTVSLADVRIGEPAAVQVDALHVGADFGALLSRRIEHASLRLSGARITLPLPPLTVSRSPTAEAADADAPASSSPAVELVSIDEIVLNDVEIVSGGRTLRGDVEIVPQGHELLIRKVALRADDATITATGRITDLSGPAAELDVKASALDFDRLMAFVNDFSSGAGLTAVTDPPRDAAGAAAPVPRPAGAGTGAPPAMDIAVALEAERATMGDLALEKLAGRARLTAQGITLDPVGFHVFGGRYDGSLSLATEGDAPSVRAGATLTGIDVAAATRFAGSPDTITGTLSGQLEFAGRGSDPASLVQSARGNARVDITDGVVRNLGLVRGVVAATSMRTGSIKSAASGSKDEPFSRLGATLTIANGAVTTQDLSFESKDLSLAAQGMVQLSASTVNLKGRVQLSEELSREAGSDLARYTQEEGRVTLPARVTGPIEAPEVRIDAGDMARRAIRNAATEEAAKRLGAGTVDGAGLSNLLKR
jgi:uncharacterized protein involved in outer membrane biogenesis